MRPPMHLQRWYPSRLRSPYIFVSDLHKPSIDYKEGEGPDHPLANPAPSSEATTVLEPEAMDIKPEVPALDDVLDWRYPFAAAPH